ncbi:hypothetical protein MTR67_046907 [Solanum verrucosum]|uniref:F-box associated domain-containing protein n=1 Tax=Solanum verrucosum TaxID=315347 RepID=A0AAF0ZUY5_SOLVR|nr:hypothetical protein MTR67_046907 [Solanum verrucosum]
MFLIRDDFAKHDFAKHGQDLFVYDENENKKIKKKNKVAFEKLHLKPELMINKNSKEEPNLVYSCEGVLMFASSRMDKEELFTMPHPISNHNVCNSKQAHLAMTLMVKDDRLCFCNMLIPWYIVDMWLLEDYETRSWIKISVELESDRRTVKKLELPRGKMLSYTDCRPRKQSCKQSLLIATRANTIRKRNLEAKAESTNATDESILKVALDHGKTTGVIKPHDRVVVFQKVGDYL